MSRAADRLERPHPERPHPKRVERPRSKPTQAELDAYRRDALHATRARWPGPWVAFCTVVALAGGLALWLGATAVGLVLLAVVFAVVWVKATIAGVRYMVVWRRLRQEAARTGDPYATAKYDKKAFSRD